LRVCGCAGLRVCGCAGLRVGVRGQELPLRFGRSGSRVITREIFRKEGDLLIGVFLPDGADESNSGDEEDESEDGEDDR